MRFSAETSDPKPPLMAVFSFSRQDIASGHQEKSGKQRDQACTAFGETTCPQHPRLVCQGDMTICQITFS